jgi:peroxin-5
MLNSFLDSRGCNVDGTTSRNPITGLVENIFESSFLGQGSAQGCESAMQGVMMESGAVPAASMSAMPVMPTMGVASPSVIVDLMEASWQNTQVGQVAGVMPMTMAGGIPMQMDSPAMMMQQTMQMNMIHAQRMQIQAMQMEHAATIQQMDTQARMHAAARAEGEAEAFAQQSSIAKAGLGMPFVESVEKINVSSEKGIDQIEDFWERMSLANKGAEERTDDIVSKQAYKEAWNELTEKLETKNIDNYIPVYSDNVHKNREDIDALFDEAMRLYTVGDIPKAIEAFEAITTEEASQVDECWRMLGVCHAENDDDKRAIICLKRCLEIDPYHLDALLGLGTSYVNELDSIRALSTLRSWVQHNPAFYGLKLEEDEYTDGTLMDEVMQLMLAASTHATSGDEVADVQIILGVLYNLSHDFDSALACFNKAMSLRPDDYSLYNKIGATLANSNRSVEAIDVYAKALEGRPNYTRAWLNLGISRANCGHYEDAVKAYIKAIRLNPNATHIYSYLRMLLTMMERLDAVKCLGEGNIDEIERLMFGGITSA